MKFLTNSKVHNPGGYQTGIRVDSPETHVYANDEKEWFTTIHWPEEALPFKTKKEALAFRKDILTVLAKYGWK